MPRIKSAKKRMHLSRKWTVQNRAARARIRTAVKKVRQAPDAAAAGTSLLEAVALLDRAGRTNLIHPNRVARVKSQLQAHVSRLSGR
ncbi:MAG: 30S ribosomal protein S20 [Gemmatimonadota bacterium]